MPAAQLAVIVPTLNEEFALPGLLRDLQSQQGLSLELIVSDGGSNDATLRIAHQHKARVTRGASGRGRQMNRGREQTRADWLLFLHADSRLPDPHMLGTALRALQAAGSGVAGHFGLRFDDAPAGQRPFYDHLERKSRCGRPQTINGDQGLLIGATFFDQLGGFDTSLPFLEDQAIAERIRQKGRWMLLPGALSTSARRFEHEGRWPRYLLMMLIMCAREAGVREFFAEARTLYPQQADTRELRLLPFYDLLLEQTRAHPDFWPTMADYARNNAWQLGFVLDAWLGTERLTPAAEQLAAMAPTGWSRRLAAPALRWLFSGPVRKAVMMSERDTRKV